MNSKTQNDELMKPRSYRAVVSAGFRFYTAHFRTLLKSSWLAAVVYSLMVGIAGLVAAVQLPKVVVQLASAVQRGSDGVALLASQKSCLLTGLLLLALTVVCLLLLAVAVGCVMARLKEHRNSHAVLCPVRWWKPDFRLVWRTVKGTFFAFLLTGFPLVLLASGIMVYAWMSPTSFAAHSSMVCTAAVVLSLLVVVAGIPVVPITTDYILGDNGSFRKALCADYKGGFRFMGGLFAIGVVDVILVAAVDLIICLPAKILLMANLSAQSGLLFGDPLGMPSFIPVLTVVTFMVCGFFQFYATLPALLHAYYAHGTILAREQERQKAAPSSL